MNPVELILIGWLVCAVFMLVLFLHAWRRRDATIVDVGWAAGIALVAVLLAAIGPWEEGRKWFVGALGTIWALRLAIYLFTNRVLGRKEEDGRYQRMRASLGRWATPAFFLFFQVQASWSILFALPLVAAMSSDRPFPGLWDVAGFMIWLVAVIGESMADRQLAAFRADPGNKGRTCRAGLWRYSRHPNYFFEWLHWFAYMAIAVGSPWWPAAVAGPIIMIVFLFKVTGIPHTERQALASRGDDYRQYQRTTSIFIPWFPRKELKT